VYQKMVAAKKEANDEIDKADQERIDKNIERNKKLAEKQKQLEEKKNNRIKVMDEERAKEF